ncbi:Mannosyltransferase DXD [Trinorchestia longiramus]|nr:Mannosyltransferase DXD [Trinorchestia longiramus]
MDRLKHLATSNVWAHLVLAAAARVVMLMYGLYHDKHHVVPYTDVDYHVLTDAARYVSQGKSPFTRHTYRYTPLLAWLMLPNITWHAAWGKMLFCSLDCLAGYLIYCIVRLGQTHDVAVRDCLLWLYNPILVAISTRGSSESVMAFLVLLMIYWHLKKKTIFTGLVLGAAVHFKLYPIIYSLPLYLSLEEREPRFSWQWFTPTRKRLELTCSTIISFLTLTYLAYFMYGFTYVQESFLYHLSRVDRRHNFSIYFYLLYLTVDQPIPGLGLVTFVPQMALVAMYGCAYATQDHLIVAMFAQTFAFVTFNKVVTSQYFVWYLVFVPLLAHNLNLSWRKSSVLFVLWVLAQGAWLVPAYLLEFQGVGVYLPIWLESIAFFCCNVGVLTAMLASYWSKYDLERNAKVK